MFKTYKFHSKRDAKRFASGVSGTVLDITETNNRFVVVVLH